MSFLSQYWFPLLFLAVIVFLLIQSQVDINKYKKQVKGYKDKIRDLQEQIDIDMKVIDSLSKIDTVYIKEIETIKGETNEKIKLVDTMSVSDMQSFYSDRYPE